MNIVNAIEKEDVVVVQKLLETQVTSQIYADVWAIGCQLSLRISDLLSLKYSDFKMADRSLKILEGKTKHLKVKKPKTIRLNDKALKVIQQRRTLYPDDVYLFQVHSNRCSGQPISRTSVSRVFKEVGDIAGLTLGTHSMRKTRGFAMYKAGVPVAKIAKVLNHSSEAVTLRYIGITAEEVLQTYDDFII